MIMEVAMGRHPKSAEVRARFWTARASGATLREATNAAGVSKLPSPRDRVSGAFDADETDLVVTEGV
jgi:hypothetical protein